jgi:hypothetical protein
MFVRLRGFDKPVGWPGVFLDNHHPEWHGNHKSVLVLFLN